jgi:hypothetical protein
VTTVERHVRSRGLRWVMFVGVTAIAVWTAVQQHTDQRGNDRHIASVEKRLDKSNTANE